MKKILLSIITVAMLSLAVRAQERFKQVDEYVQSLGSLDTLNAGTISYILTSKFSDNTSKVRAIFTWIAKNISMDAKAAKNGSNEKMLGDLVLKTRKANPNGYAALFQDMCSVAKIRCLTVDGYVKKNIEQLNEMPDELNHTWDVVQLGQSPETWYYVDPCMGSGVMDDKNIVFTKSFNDHYFFADKTIFNYQHYPDNQAWLLGPVAAKSAKDFFAMPVVKQYAYEAGLSSFAPLTGKIKAGLKKAVAFSFKVKADTKIDIVALQLGPEKRRVNKTVDFSNSSGVINFTYKFDDEDSYPVTIMVNNQPLLGYFVEITE